MRRLAILLPLLAGCAGHAGGAANPRAAACACVGLAMATLDATQPPSPAPAKKCCGTCGRDGLPPGKTLSGDRLKVVPCGPTTCGCPEDCPCKKAAACTTGTCR